MDNKEYIGREAAIEYLTLNMGWNDEDGYPVDDWDERKAAIADLINGIPAADVRPVVLCKDCRHRDPEDHKCDCGQIERAGCVFPVDDDYFCAYGEKREES